MPGEKHLFTDAVKGSYVSEVNFAAFANALISAQVMLFTDEQVQKHKNCINKLTVFVELVKSFDNQTNEVGRIAALRRR